MVMTTKKKKKSGLSSSLHKLKKNSQKKIDKKEIEKKDDKKDKLKDDPSPARKGSLTVTKSPVKKT